MIVSDDRELYCDNQISDNIQKDDKRLSNYQLDEQWPTRYFTLN